MEKSLVLIKPDAVSRNISGEIIARFEKKGLELRALKMLQLDTALARRHYAVHADKPFFKDLVEYITSGPIVAMVLEGDNAVDRIRQTMGATDPSKADPGTIRRDFGLNIQSNAVHGSDSVENAKKEIALFFEEKEVYG